MGQNFYPDTVNHTLLFPPSLHDWLPEGHLARFLLDVVSALDLSAIYKSYQDKDGRGQSRALAIGLEKAVLVQGRAEGVIGVELRAHGAVAQFHVAAAERPEGRNRGGVDRAKPKARGCYRSERGGSAGLQERTA